MDNDTFSSKGRKKVRKTGYVRIVSDIADEYISYKELSFYSETAMGRLRERLNRGEKRMYCACCEFDELELQVTANNVVRVKNNGQQDRHMESCPKSIRYGAWVSENVRGAGYIDDAGHVLFQITLPGTGEASGSSTVGSGAVSKGGSRIRLLDMVKTINEMAWEKQTYSRKKEIALARKEGRVPNLRYKSLREFSQLIYGISHEIYVQYGANIVPFHTLYYQAGSFWSCTDYKKRFFVYAEIARFNTYRAEWKYQYITLWLPGKDGKKQTTFRVRTDVYDKMIGNVDKNSSKRMILAGYANHSAYGDNKEGCHEWANLLKGVVFYVSEKGLYAETEYVAGLIDSLCDSDLIFKRPYIPLENYYNYTPTLLIEVLQGKNILIDVVEPAGRKLKEHYRWAEENPEYSCIVFRNGEDTGDIVSRVQSIAGRRS